MSTAAVRAGTTALVAMLTMSVFACRQDEQLTEAEHRARGLAKDVAMLASPDARRRQEALTGVISACCHFERDRWSAKVREENRLGACGALERLLLTERDLGVLSDALVFENDQCHMTIPATGVLRLVTEEVPIDIQRKAARWLQLAEPSPEATRVILERSSRLGRNSALRLELMLALRSFGEADLVPVVEAISDADRLRRDAGLQAISFALSAPLDLPGALNALDEVARKPDDHLAAYAEAIAERYRQNVGIADDAIVRSYDDERITVHQIRMLGVRRFACIGHAEKILEREASRAITGAAAKRALDLRSKRCPR
jgi:hypothetical protein